MSEHDGIEFWSQVLFNYVHKKGFMLRIWRLGLPNAEWVEINSEGLFLLQFIIVITMPHMNLFHILNVFESNKQKVNAPL